MIKKIKTRLRAFIIQTIVEDYQKNGRIRQMISGDLNYVPGYVTPAGLPEAVYIGTTPNGVQLRAVE